MISNGVTGITSRCSMVPCSRSRMSAAPVRMIESMVTAIAQNLAGLLTGETPSHEATWNAFCLADFGDGGVAFIAQPQIPPRNVNWSASGKWVHLAKAGFEKYFVGKIKRGESEPFYEKLALDMIGLRKIKG